MAQSKKKAPAKKEVEAQSQEENGGEEAKEKVADQKDDSKVQKERRDRRVITIVSKDESDYLDSFDLSRSAISRAILRGTMEFLSQFASKKDVTEAEITEALQAKLK